MVGPKHHNRHQFRYAGIFNEITLNGISYTSILSRNIIEGSFEFGNGYGEIVKQFGEKYGFGTSHVKLVEKTGMIFFKQMPLLEAIRRMELIANWHFFFRDKEMIFEPCQPPQDSGVTIIEDQVTKGTYTNHNFSYHMILFINNIIISDCG